MGRSKRKPSGMCPYETRYKKPDGRADTFVRFSVSLHLSEAFQSLKNRQKMLLISMMQQKTGYRKPSQEIAEDSPYYDKVKGEYCFFFPYRTAIEFCPEYTNNHSRLYSDIKVLIDRGFIEVVYSGKTSKTKSVYRYSEKWKSWKTAESARSKET